VQTHAHTYTCMKIFIAKAVMHFVPFNPVICCRPNTCSRSNSNSIHKETKTKNINSTSTNNQRNNNTENLLYIIEYMDIWFKEANCSFLGWRVSRGCCYLCPQKLQMVTIVAISSDGVMTQDEMPWCWYGSGTNQAVAFLNNGRLRGQRICF
jgi:hypothetical protein